MRTTTDEQTSTTIAVMGGHLRLVRRRPDGFANPQRVATILARYLGLLSHKARHHWGRVSSVPVPTPCREPEPERAPSVPICWRVFCFWPESTRNWRGLSQRERRHTAMNARVLERDR